jgi:hypothetical protein
MAMVEKKKMREEKKKNENERKREREREKKKRKRCSRFAMCCTDPDINFTEECEHIHM